jgi:hypothetical protein
MGGDWAKVVVESNSRAAVKLRQPDFISVLQGFLLLNCGHSAPTSSMCITVIVNYNTRAGVKPFSSLRYRE